METHKSLNPEIDKDLIFNIMNSEQKRPLLSYLYLVYDKLLFNFNYTESEEEKKQVYELVHLVEQEDSSALTNELEIADRKLLEYMWELHLFYQQELYQSLDDYLNSKIQKKIHPLFKFFKNDLGEVTSIYFDLEELAKILSTYSKELNFNKIQDQAFELENVRCPISSVIHQLVILNNFDNSKVLYYPNETFEVFNKLNIIFEYIFKAEYELKQILENIDEHLNDIKRNLITLLPIYFIKWRKIENYLKKSKLEEKNLFIYLKDNEEKIDEDIFEVLSPIENKTITEYSTYTTGLRRILEADSDLKNIKEQAEKEYSMVFSDKARTYFSTFISSMPIDGPRDYGNKIDDLFSQYRKTVNLFKAIDIKEIEIAYHQYSLQRLGVL